MSAETELDSISRYDGYADEPKPIGGYAVLMATFGALASAFALWFRSCGRELPERVELGDLLLLSCAAHKASRTIAKDRVTSTLRMPFTRYQEDAGPGEVSEQARGRGLRRAIGELLICPYCLGLWISAGLTAGLLVAPRCTRWLASTLTVFFGSDLLQIAYRKAEQSL